MNKILTIFFAFLINSTLWSQTIEKPEIRNQDNKRVIISQIKRTSEKTIIDLFYLSNKNFKEAKASINPKIKIKETYGTKTYKIKSIKGIPLSPNKKTIEYEGQAFTFRLEFERVPSSVSRIDIIDCENSDCFNFYGIKLKSSSSSSSSDKETYTSNSDNDSDRFRRDYNMVSVFDYDTEEWGEWKSGENTFVINYNSNGDIAHYKANGEPELYRKISGVKKEETEEGVSYQIITALDEEGHEFKFQIFDNSKYGLKMIYGSFMVQFAKS